VRAYRARAPDRVSCTPSAALASLQTMASIFTAEQLAASAAAGDPRTETDFDTREAWEAYKDTWFYGLRPTRQNSSPRSGRG
jgi:hypothetical protein